MLLKALPCCIYSIIAASPLVLLPWSIGILIKKIRIPLEIRTCVQLTLQLTQPRRPAGGGFCHMPHDQSKPFACPGRIRQ
ncbi:hypothetical protein PAECIP111892_03969 [Paenibacillus auburnensis]|jgi:hypothetical protein|uniref:Uncharacterized protein n=1 Tax=Paenibacillus auburnensis TaxID=2905649 RepID=A0ABM9CHK9_9BACL|nr:hypothetical protein PAECIP111892_03969 [Paenibacillus auburnensis]